MIDWPSLASYHHQLPLYLPLRLLAGMENAQPATKGGPGIEVEGGVAKEEETLLPALPPPPAATGELMEATASLALAGEIAVPSISNNATAPSIKLINSDITVSATGFHIPDS